MHPGVRIPVFLLVMSLMAGYGADAAAQSLTHGSVRGVVRSDAGQPLAGIRVLLAPAGGGAIREGVTDRAGLYHFLLVRPGVWTVSAERLGYRPAVMTGVHVRPGAESFAIIPLTAAPPPVTVVDTVSWAGGGEGSRPAGWLTDDMFRRAVLPGAGPRGALEPVTGRDDQVAGFPGVWSGYAVEGVATSRAVHPGLGVDPVPDLAWPREALAAVEFDGGPVEAERGGDPAGTLTGYIRPGTRNFAIRAAGDWGPALASSRFFAPEPADRGSWRGAVSVSGPVIPDTAHFAFTAAFEDLSTVTPAPWGGATGADTVFGAARDAWTVDLAPWRLPVRSRQRIAHVVGRFDWQAGERHLVGISGAVGRVETDHPDYGGDRLGWLGTSLTGTDWHVGASVVSRLGTAINEVHLGFGRVERTAAGPPNGRTTLVAEALRIGPSAGFVGARSRSELSFTETIRLPMGRHQVTLGAGLRVGGATSTWAWGTGGDLFFADATRLAAGEGVLVRVAGAPPSVQHTRVGVEAWFQDAWRVAPALDLVFGLRLDAWGRPTTGVTPNVAWQARTGLVNAVYDPSVIRVSPRGAVRWRPGEAGRWRVELSAGTHASRYEYDTFSELMAYDGRVSVERAVGTLGAWPQPTTGVTPRPRLSLLGPDYVPPRAGRIGLDIVGDLGGIVLRLNGAYRHTDFLLRRTNLNRLPGPTGTDQYGRPLYGTLVQQGGLLAADPASARRFAEFDVVSALNAAAAQDRWEATIALERSFSHRVGLLLVYTWSDTRDDWLSAFGGAPEDQLDPFPEGLAGGRWAEGVSDLDRPHRFAAVVDLGVVSAIRLGGTFRLESGMPFTPGFRPGVDANADGSARNDPAFIDAAVPGMDAVLAASPCLRLQVGRFAERNACRTPAARALDVWFRLELPRLSGLPLALRVEVRNLIEPDIAVPDAAVYLVDDAATLVSDPATGGVTVPLVANPNFGRPLFRRGSARVIRFGIRINDR